MDKNKSTNILLIIVIILLGLLLFRGKIQAYFKARDVLKRANIYNIVEVAFACWDVIPDDESIPNTRCSQTLEEYKFQIVKWNDLIKQYRDIDCKDFENKKEANDFYEYMSGELAGGIYLLKVQNEGLIREVNPLTIGKIMGKKHNGHCRYDSYGLDTNSDCDACENYSQ